MIQIRLKKLRTTLKLTQKQVADQLGLGQSTYAMIESGKREFLDRHIKTISAIYSVNPEWLKNGTGEMFIDPFDTFIDELSGKYSVDDTLRSIVKSYLKLTPEQQKAIGAFMRGLSE